MPFQELDETQTAKMNAMLQELYAAVAAGGGAPVLPVSAPTQEEALAIFNDMWRISIIGILGNDGTPITYNPSLKEGQIINQLPLDRGGWLVGGNCGFYSHALLPNGSPNPNAVFSHGHCDYNEVGYDQIRTSPGLGSTQAQHITSNNRNGWINQLGIRALFLTQPTTINACGMVDWNRSDGGQVVGYGTLWGFRFLKF